MRGFVFALAALAALTVSCSSAPQSEDTAGTGEPAPAAPDLEVGEYAKVYRGDEGLRVTLVPVAGGGEPVRALIEVTGLPNEIDGLVLLYERVPQGRGAWSYRTTLNGEGFHTIWKRSRGGSARLQIFLPGRGRDRLYATYDEEASNEVDPQELADRYAELVSDGTIAELQKFNRAEREARNDEELAEEMSEPLEDCGKEVPVSIDWSTFSDEHLKDYSIHGYCDAIGEGIEELCEHPQGREAFQSRVKEIRCERGGEHAVELGGDGTLVWIAHLKGVNADRAARDLTRARFGRDRVVLATESGLYLTLDPGDSEDPIHYSKDGETFYEHAETANSGGGSHRWLFAAGMRSELEYEDERWTLTCGQQEAELRELPAKKAKALLEKAKLEDHEWKRKPFALARDDRGRYYYVDHLRERYGGKGYRVFIGLKGNVDLTDLMDIVNDSQGTIFATRNGKLRLIINRDGDPGRALWIRGKQKKRLTVLPPGRNQELIYRELGAYRGESLGTICEEL